jgi:hypothetical protein
VAHPPHAGPWQAALIDYYNGWDRRLPQLTPACAHYDSILGYALKPARCRFTNREFSVDMVINSGGFRDDERGLAAPDVVVIGDSYAMGWGVAQDSTFADQLEARTGLTTLNTGVSSYGTARELLSLGRVNLADARYLIIQYCDNDFRENSEFVAGHGHLSISSRAAYDTNVAQHERSLRYYPGKYLRRRLPFVEQRLAGKSVDYGLGTASDPSREA